LPFTASDSLFIKDKQHKQGASDPASSSSTLIYIDSKAT